MFHFASVAGRTPPPSSPALKAAAVSAGVGLRRLADAESRAAQLGVPLDAVLVNEGIVTEERLYRAVARILGAPFLADCPDLEPPGAGPEARSAGMAPCRDPRRAGVDIVLAPRGHALAMLLGAMRGGVPPGTRVGIVTPSSLAAAIRRRYAARMAGTAATTVAARDPNLSARGRPQRNTFLIVVLVAVLLPLAGAAWPLLGDAAASAIALLALSTVILRLVAASASLPRAKALAIPDRDLPLYTVLVPLHDEAAIVPQLSRALLDLDYPKAKLDIKLLLEEDDVETLRAVEALQLPACFETIVCPPGRPRTKPRALNIGLAAALGPLVCVFDAEDRPEPGQLRRAAERFAAGDPRLACLQASLHIDNAADGWLPRLFALEYAALFDVLLPGLAARGMPLPLGGTSNHFRRFLLERAGAWDAWNVTEDADLGLRLARMGYRTETLASFTREAAPRSLRTWFGQRTRWLKGWMQTAMVHGLAPGQSLAGYRLSHRLAVLSLGAGTAGTALLFPIGTVALPLWLMEAWPTRAEHPFHVLAIGLACIVPLLGAIAIVWPVRLAAGRRGLRFGLRETLLLIPYYLLVSAAAWWALAELFAAPSYWRKTDHAPSVTRTDAGLG
jgi:uncharacterized membrane protein YbhN (UPF0104 family)